MTYTFLKNGHLKLAITSEDQQTLQTYLEENKDTPGEKQESEFMEGFLANSEFDWIPDGVITGDLTSSPCIGIRGDTCEKEDLPEKRFGEQQAGHWADKDRFEPIIGRWRWMHYAVRNFLDELAETGECEWEGGWADEKDQLEAEHAQLMQQVHHSKESPPAEVFARLYELEEQRRTMKAEEVKESGLGLETRTHRGFRMVEFKDHNEQACTVQASSLAVYEKPGTSAIWLGTDDANPQVMAKDAARLGVQTDKTCGWVPFPVPKEVLLSTRMHLNREQVEALIEHLQNWLEYDQFSLPEGALPGGWRRVADGLPDDTCDREVVVVLKDDRTQRRRMVGYYDEGDEGSSLWYVEGLEGFAPLYDDSEVTHWRDRPLEKLPPP